MVKVNILSDALRTIVNAERKGKKQVLLKPVSKVLLKFLRIMQKHNYIGEFEIIDDHRSKKVVIELIGRINKCGVISPNYDILLPDFEKWTNNILPSRQFGHLVISTNQGIFTHEEARERHIGGKIIGFFYWMIVKIFNQIIPSFATKNIHIINSVDVMFRERIVRWDYQNHRFSSKLRIFLVATITILTISLSFEDSAS